MQILSKKLIKSNINLNMFGQNKGAYIVYGIVCIRTGLTYIGYTTSKRYPSRIIEHRTTLKRGIHTNRLLQDVYNNSTLLAYTIAKTDSNILAQAIEQFCISHVREGVGLGLNINDNKQVLNELIKDVKKLSSTNKATLKKLSISKNKGGMIIEKEAKNTI